MANPNQVAEIGLLVGEPARAAMLVALMDGRALTATELARVAGIMPQTASGHLAKLTAANLLAVARQGRHRYHRLASPDIARLLENIMQIATVPHSKTHRVIRVGPRDAAMRAARTCYDHLAGGLGVTITDALLDRSAIEFDDDAGMITESGVAMLSAAGISMPERAPKSSRPLCRPCLDWSERRPHVAGKLGAALCAHFFDNGLVRRIGDTRALTVTPKGAQALKDLLGVREWR
jgi:DNA-binding transcriptional ArsR family regulator